MTKHFIQSSIKWLASLLLLAGLASCDYREASPARLERATGLRLPAQSKVLANKYQSMQQDYSLLYVLELSQADVPTLTRQIRSSKFFNPAASVATDSAVATVGQYEGNWARTSKGYGFQGAHTESRAVYSAALDTASGILEYHETSN